MKLTIRMWIMAIVLLSCLVWIFNISTFATLSLLGLGVGVLVVLTTVKSNIGKVFIIIVLLASGVFLVYQQTQTGVEIKSVEFNSTAYEQGLRQGQVIIAVNGESVETMQEYLSAVSSEFPEVLDKNKKISIQTKEQEFLLFTNQAPEIIVGDITKTNLKLGLDLQGGSRALVKAENKSLTTEEIQDLISVTNNRLNVYGLSDMVIKSVSDLSGNNYMLIEIAGATPTELEALVGQQGKSEAKIGNETVFSGTEGIAHVERAGQFAGIEGCYETQQEGYYCRFRFPITLTEKAAKNHAEVTSKLGLSTENPQYLSEKLDLYIDDNLISSLSISKDLKGRETTQISIQGSGVGHTRADALDNAQDEMNKLQTILITGSLPYKLEIVKLDTISPSLGKKFINSILLAGVSALVAVALIIMLRYRKLKLPLALLLTSFSEVIIIIGIASLLNKVWSLDLPAIAGIIAVIGTGVDQQIVVLDESRSGQNLSLKQRLKRAAAIILGSYFTTIGAMFPLIWSGAGLLKGFAIATIVGISVGVFITRPAFADIVKRIED